MTHFLFFHLLLLLLLHLTPSSARCHRSCGTSPPLPYPFGFSPDCLIRLNCSSKGDILLGDSLVKNITSSTIILSLPAKCDRPIRSLDELFTANYAVTSRSNLLLSNCTTNQECAISTNSIRSHFKHLECEMNMNMEMSISCLSSEKNNFLRINYSDCGTGTTLFSSILASEDDNKILSFEFQTIELGWWLEQEQEGQLGGCKGCATNAECTEVVSPFNGRLGFRCRCENGYAGDGFSAGRGCRKAKCSASKYMSGECGGTTRIGVLIGGIIGGASSMVGLALLCYLVRRKSSSLKSRSARHIIAEAAGSCSIPFYSYKEIERATSYFSEGHRIGTGAYGTVYAGKLHNDECVAIKKIRHREADGIEQVMNEIKLVSSVNHPNLVRLLGCCIERDEQILVYEFMPNGTLSQHLQRERGSSLSWSTRLNIATETAQAIAYLHCADNPIYHRDIKSSNILLDYEFKSKVADFGLSRLGLTELSHISTAPQGTPGYLDPQYHQNFHLSDKSDVYSFGVVLVEVITALKVVDFSRPNSEVNLAALAVEKIGKGCVDEIMDPFLEPHTDAWTLSSVHKVAELAFRCLAFHQDMRPSMMEVAAELECIRLCSWGPLEENECLGSSFSALSITSDKSQNLSTKKAALDSRRLVVPLRSNVMIPLDELEDSSPISVQEPWFSEQSSPSADSLLGNVMN